MPMRDGGGEIRQTDEFTGYEIPTVKVALGDMGSDDGPVSTANPMPVSVTTSPLAVSQNGSLIAEGSDTLRSTAYKFGYNSDVDLAAAEDVIDVGGTLVETLAGTPATVSLSSDSADDVLYAGTLTFTANAKDGETVTIGTKIYTFQSVLTDVDGNVLLGGSASDSLDNLIAAINLSVGAGALYAASMTANPAPTSAVAGAGDTMTLYAESAIATTDGMGASAAWGAATTVAGTGAQTVTVYGLDASGNLQSETINMTGITLADSVNTYSFIYRALVASAGSGGTNAGAISITDNPLSEYYAQIVAGNGQTLMAAYMVPTDYEMYISSVHFALGSAPPAGADVVCDLFAKPSGGAYNLKYRTALATGGTTASDHAFDIPLKFSAGTIVKMRATTNTNNTSVAGSWDGYLKDIS